MYKNVREHLITHFTFNEAIKDRTNRSNVISDKVLHPVITTNKARLNKSAFFDSTMGDKIITDLEYGNYEKLSICLWLNINNLPEQQAPIFMFGDNINGVCLEINSLNDSLFTLTNICNGTCYSTEDIFVSRDNIGKWFHLAILVENNTFSTYLNGSYADSGIMRTSVKLIPEESTLTFNPLHLLQNTYINDFRIYDTHIDPLVVDELFQCKIVDYDFSYKINSLGVAVDKSEFKNDTMENHNVPKQIEFSKGKLVLLSDHHIKDRYLSLGEYSCLKDNMTINAWVYINKQTFIDTDSCIISSDDLDAYSIKIVPGGIRFSAKNIDGSYNNCNIRSANLRMGWNMITFVCNKNGCIAYSNGSRVSFVSYISNCAFEYHNETVVKICNDNNGKSPSCLLGEVQIFASALHQHHVESLFSKKSSYYESDDTQISLIGHLPLDRNCNDTRGNICVSTNNLPTITENKSKLFKSAYFELGNRIETDFNIDSFNSLTLSFWIMVQKESTGGCLIYSDINEYNGLSIKLDTDNRCLSFRDNILGTSFNTTIDNAFEYDSWTHVTWVYDNENSSIYINGLERFKGTFDSEEIELANTDVCRLCISDGNISGVYLNDIRIYTNNASNDDIREILATEILSVNEYTIVDTNRVLYDMGIFDNTYLAKSSDQPLLGMDGAINDTCLEFNGENYLELNDIVRIHDTLSVSMWVNLEKQSTRMSIIDGFMGGYNIHIQNNVLYIGYFDDTNYHTINTVLDDSFYNTWNHIVAVYGNKGLKLFINGELVSYDTSDNYSNNIYYASNKPILIGANYIDFDSDQKSNYMTGKIDDIKFFAGELTYKTVNTLQSRIVSYGNNDTASFNDIIMHYALDGDLIDRSYNHKDAEVIGSLLYSHDGKVGKCVDGSNNSGLRLPNIEIKKNMSFSIWVKSNVTSINDRARNIFNKSSKSTNASSFGLDWNIDNDLCLWLKVVGKDSSIKIVSSMPDIREWTLFTAVIGDTHMSLYKNCDLIDSVSIENETIDSSDNYNLYVGKCDNKWGSIDGFYNDFKVYNYPLTIGEIRETYMSIVANFNFNDAIKPTINYVNYFTPLAETDDYIIEYEQSTNMYKFIAKKNSWEYSGNKLLGKISKDITCEANDPVTVSFTYIGSSMHHSRYLPIFSNGMNHITRELNMVPNKRYFKTLSVSSPSTYALYLYCVNGDITDPNSPETIHAGDWWIIKDPQIEKNSYCSPYSGSTEQYDDEIIDGSGYNHNLIALFDHCPSYIEDSVIGKGCYRFNRLKQNILQTKKFLNVKQYTVSLWFRSDGEYITSGMPDIVGGTLIAINSTDYYPLLVCVKNENILIDTFSNQHIGRKEPSERHIVKFTLSQWHHLALRFKLNGNVEVFLDNKKVSTFSAGSYYLPTELCTISLGDENPGRGVALNCDIANVKVYTTVADDMEINKLFMTRAELDSQNNMYCNTFEELPNLASSINDDILYGVTDNIRLFSSDPKATATLENNQIKIKKSESTASTSRTGVALLLPSGTFKRNGKYLVMCRASGYNYTKNEGELIAIAYNGDSINASDYRRITPIEGLLPSIPINQYASKSLFNVQIGGILDLDDFAIQQSERYNAREVVFCVSNKDVLSLGTEVFLDDFRIYDITEEYDRIKDTQYDAIITKSVLKPSMDSRGVFRISSFSELGIPARYIKSRCSIQKPGTWREIQAISNGVNIAYHKRVLCNFTASGNNNTQIITDGRHDTYVTANPDPNDEYLEVMIDLCDICDISAVHISRKANESYTGNKLMISADSVEWITIFDSDRDGTYVEPENGRTFYCYNDKISMSEEVMYARNFIEG